MDYWGVRDERSLSRNLNIQRPVIFQSIVYIKEINKEIKLDERSINLFLLYSTTRVQSPILSLCRQMLLWATASKKQHGLLIFIHICFVPDLEMN